MEPTKTLACQEGSRLKAAWAFASGRQPGVTCKRSWDSTGGSRIDFMVGCPRAAAAVSRCVVQEDRWILPHLAFVRTLSIHGGFLVFLSQFSARLFGLPPGCLCLIRVVGLSLRKFKGFLEIYDDRLQFMTVDGALGSDEALEVGDVSCLEYLVVCCSGCPC